MDRNHGLHDDGEHEAEEKNGSVDKEWVKEALEIIAKTFSSVLVSPETRAGQMNDTIRYYLDELKRK